MHGFKMMAAIFSWHLAACMICVTWMYASANLLGDHDNSTKKVLHDSIGSTKPASPESGNSKETVVNVMVQKWHDQSLLNQVSGLQQQTSMMAGLSLTAAMILRQVASIWRKALPSLGICFMISSELNMGSKYSHLPCAQESCFVAHESSASTVPAGTTQRHKGMQGRQVSRANLTAKLADCRLTNFCCAAVQAAEAEMLAQRSQLMH